MQDLHYICFWRISVWSSILLSIFQVLRPVPPLRRSSMPALLIPTTAAATGMCALRNFLPRSGCACFASSGLRVRGDSERCYLGFYASNLQMCVGSLPTWRQRNSLKSFLSNFGNVVRSERCRSRCPQLYDWCQPNRSTDSSDSLWFHG